MNTNRIANIDDKPDEIISLEYIAGLAANQPFFTLTLNESGKFQLFFDEDSYRQAVSETECAVDEESVAAECQFYTEEIEIKIAERGGI